MEEKLLLRSERISFSRYLSAALQSREYTLMSVCVCVCNHGCDIVQSEMQTLFNIQRASLTAVMFIITAAVYTQSELVC